ncbi:hypothetical protein JTB14_011735 [Gonioctena quinquepunctata]|nr:hypothetical protein JTB14_011735 [Gonioctena quinquepunctata]
MLEKEASQGVETSEASHHTQSASTTPTSSTKLPFSQMVPPQRAKVLKRFPSNKRQPTGFESAVTKLQQIAESTTADTEDQYDQFGKRIASQLRELPLNFVILPKLLGTEKCFEEKLQLQEHSKNIKLITSKVHGLNGRQQLKEQWIYVDNALNPLGNGTKSVLEWRRAVTDWKSKTKVKWAKINKELKTTGGGSWKNIGLPSIEERLLNLMGRKCQEGDEVAELGLDKEFPSYQHEDINYNIDSMNTNSNVPLDHSYYSKNTKNDEHEENNPEATNVPLESMLVLPTSTHQIMYNEVVKKSHCVG